MTFKAAWRGLILILSLGLCFLYFVPIFLRAALAGRDVLRLECAQWMQRCGLTMLRAMGIRFRVEGKIPTETVVVAANHLSYLDIVIASAAMPCAFVAKEEIAGWPVFGKLARMGHTIFLNRASRASAWDAADRMVERLKGGIPVLFFPEGTSTDGSQLARFHSTLFAAAMETGCSVVPAAIFYEPHDAGMTERDVCWYGDEAFLPHLIKVLGLNQFTAVLRFGAPERYPDRRTAAWRSHDAVETLRKQGSLVR
ncbi:MAG TPA: lysophospholipid acyltransferase family protein [Acidobacteriaceae bacterium]|nr:lysophospholipid acyltransferase family protein [Acidobacteriaceae bacterium]